MNKTHSRPSVSDISPNEQTVLRSKMELEYAIYEEGLHLWEEQRKSLEDEGWFRHSSDGIDNRAIREISAGGAERGHWNASDAVYAEGLDDIEFEESDSGEPCDFWRWTSPGKIATLWIPFDKSQTLLCSLSIKTTTPRTQLDNLTVKLEGELLGLRYRGVRSGQFLLDFIVPPKGRKLEASRIDLELTKVIPPTTEEPRQLGVALSYLEWRPL